VADVRPPRSVGSVLRAIWPPLPVWRRLDLAVTVIAVYTALVVGFDMVTGLRLPDWTGISTILNALVLGVLLSFRNREAYERWWEARKLWGQLINDSRNMCAKAAALPRLSADARTGLGKLVPAFAVALKNRLRGDGKLQQVPGFEAETGDPPHVPFELFGQLTRLLQAERTAGRLTEVDLLLLDPHVRGLMDVCGACERIKSTPVPLSYRSLLRHGMVLYLLSTPWLVADRLGWWTVPVEALFGYFLLGVELTAEDVEEPFGRDGDDLALSAYCDTIRRSAEQALGPRAGAGDLPLP
jgi:ion channel-forming bestrophin family protein